MKQHRRPTPDGVNYFNSGVVDENGHTIVLDKKSYDAAYKFYERAQALQEKLTAEEIDQREAEYASFKQKLTAHKEHVAAVEKRRDAIHLAEKYDMKAWKKAKEEEASGVVMLRVYEDLGPVWTDRWMVNFIYPDVPELIGAGINVNLTCKALMRGLEAYKERRRARRIVRDPAAFVIEVATEWQKSRPTYRVPLNEALAMPERIAPSR